MTTTELTRTQRRERVEKALAFGQRRCTEGGLQPTMANAVREILIEAMRTMAALPDRESGWLKSRSSMPDYVKEAMDYLDPDEEPKPIPPRKDAIDRLDEVLSWLQFTQGKGYEKRRRNLQIVISMSMGVAPHRIAGRARVHYNSVHRIYNEQLKYICFELNKILRDAA